jgi:large subunit ribosomal protein L9
MDLILLERVEKLGRIGDIVKVRPGYARNYLLPRGKALRASEENKKRFEANRAQIEADNETRRVAAAGEAKSLEGTSLVLVRQASNAGHLYGSVAARDLVDALGEQGAGITRSQVVLDRPIKTIGIHEVRVALHPEVSVTIQVNVARSPEEAELQAKGVDVTSEMFERDESGFTEEFVAEDEGAEGGNAGDEGEAEPS